MSLTIEHFKYISKGTKLRVINTSGLCRPNDIKLNQIVTFTHISCGEFIHIKEIMCGYWPKRFEFVDGFMQSLYGG